MQYVLLSATLQIKMFIVGRETEKWIDRKIEREKEREREWKRQTDRETDRQIKLQKDATNMNESTVLLG